ncbi:hypothetical protein PSQ90_07455 [Devosia rhodophyticola]|uniref:JmjC domain-containing protein n=1 Tax=Devosia rhodophyticola TaxID=3026423 RepID=A0ABY7Z0U5_9HYPH|nr:hypothetical protein [Devosia rhodophyticola]WDR07251.1 hypothetical protein PSQ90_07455 [Devosia rhodophyticola]
MMHATAKDWTDLGTRWVGPRNFRIAPSMIDFDFTFAPIDQIIDEMRHDEEASIKSGLKATKLELATQSTANFQQLPMEQVMERPFALAHFNLARFDAPGKFLHGFGDRVLQRWQDTLAAQGFTWERCYPIIFISGKGSATNYHMDFSHVLAWQVFGTKRFCGLVDPDHWADSSVRNTYIPGELAKPTDVREEDSLCYDMRPGDKLWNVLLTPHWVEAGDEPAMSINISHGALRLNGQLSPNESELEALRAAKPGQGPTRLVKSYR